MEQRQKVSLLVDGKVLKQHILNCHEKYTAQAVMQYLHHMVREIKRSVPNSDICVNYYGVRAAEKVAKPISGKPYEDIDIKSVLHFSKLPDAEFKTIWGRMNYIGRESWILKPDCYDKNHLEDDDFRLDEQPKGLLTQLIDTMAEKAVLHSDDLLFVYGDAEDMAYAIETTNGLGLPVCQVLLDGKTPSLQNLFQTRVPTVVNPQALVRTDDISQLDTETDQALEQRLNALRKKVGDQPTDQVLLMLDMAGVRKYLSRKNLRMSRQNVQKILEQIQQALPEQPTKTIFYHSNVCDVEEKKMERLENAGIIEFQFDSELFKSMPDVEFSLGKTQKDKEFPFILNPAAWHLKPSARSREDLMPNFRQYDVDDRIAYDMALARMAVKAPERVRRVFLMTSDEDFLRSIEKARAAGLRVDLVRLRENFKSMSSRLAKGADDIIWVDVDLDALVSREEEKRQVQKRNDETRRAEMKARRKKRRLLSYVDDEDDDGDEVFFRERKPSKEERWTKARVSNKNKLRKLGAKARHEYE